MLFCCFFTFLQIQLTSVNEELLFAEKKTYQVTITQNTPLLEVCLEDKISLNLLTKKQEVLNFITDLQLYLKKETLAHVFSCEFWEISKNTFFTEHLRATALVCHTVSQMLWPTSSCDLMILTFQDDDDNYFYENGFF